MNAERFIEELKSPAVLITIIAILIPPLTSMNPYLLNVFIIMLVFIIFSSAWNLLAYSGQGSLGHAAFFGIGGYISTLAAVATGITPYITIFLGGAVAAVVGVLIGLTCVRLREWFLAMVTFGFAIIVQTITVSILAQFTGGWDGIASPRLLPSSIPNYLTYEYYSVVAITIGVILFIRYIIHSRIGIALAAIRENEREAQAAGINLAKYKLLAFCLSAYIAGLAGALEIHHFGYITPEIFGIDISFWPVIYTILGGLGTIAGPIIGTIVLTGVWDGLKLAGMTYERFIIIGLILIITVIFLPKGLVSLPEVIKEKVAQWRSGKEGQVKKEETGG